MSATGANREAFRIWFEWNEAKHRAAVSMSGSDFADAARQSATPESDLDTVLLDWFRPKPQPR